MDQSSEQESRTLFMGDIQSWMDQKFLQALVESLGYSKELACTKMIREKTTGLPAKYCFLEFVSRTAALNFYTNYNKQPIPDSTKQFTLKWAARAAHAKSNAVRPARNQTQVYVGNLDLTVTDYQLLELFQAKYSSAKSANIITDDITKISKGYGFVNFLKQEDAKLAIQEVNNQKYNGRVLKVNAAHSKSKEEENVEDNETQISQRLKVYRQFYSMMNDPQLKAEYEKQVQRTFGGQQGKKVTMKQNMESMKTLEYLQTVESEEVLNVLPKMVLSRAKWDVEARIFA